MSSILSSLLVAFQSFFSVLSTPIPMIFLSLVFCEILVCIVFSLMDR